MNVDLPIRTIELLAQGRLIGGANLSDAASMWKPPHGMGGKDKSGKVAGGGGEFAKQVMQWPSPRTITGGAESGKRKKELGRLELNPARWPRESQMIDRIWNLMTGRKASAAGPRSMAWLAGLRQPVWTPADYAHLAKEAYQQNVTGFSAVSLIAKACAGIPLLHYEQRGAKLKQIESGPLVQLFRRPNPQQGYSAFTRRLISQYLLAGNAYIERVGPDGKPPRELYAQRPDLMRVIPGDKIEPIAGYVWALNTPDETRWLPDRVQGKFVHRILHWHDFHPTDDWYGLSPLQAAARSFDQNNESRAWNVALLQNAARPPGAFSAQEQLTEEQFERLRELVEDRYAGSRNAGRPLLLEGGIKWEEFGLSPVEMAWIEGLKISTREICGAFGVAPELLGDSANKTYSNYETARKALYQDTVLPLMDSLCSELTAWLQPFFGEQLLIGYDRDKIEAIQEDRDKAHARAREDVRGGVISPNEARESIGYEARPEEGADSLYLQATQIPLESVSSWEVVPGSNVQTEQEAQPAQDGSKAFNLASPEAKAKYWQGFDNARNAWYGYATARVRAQFERERAAMNAAVNQQGAGAESAIDGFAADWNALLKSLYMAVGSAFAADTAPTIKAALPLERKAVEDSLLVDLWLLELRQYVDSVMGLKIVKILDTTRDAVRRTLLEGIEAGEGVYKLAQRIDALYLEQIIPHRSEVIARTEVIAASNAGSQAAAKAVSRQSGLQLAHEWLATPDLRTRDAHAAANGQVKPMSEPFIVDGERLMFPGDTSLDASAGNVIQCRCVETYRPIK